MAMQKLKDFIFTEEEIENEYTEIEDVISNDNQENINPYKKIVGNNNQVVIVEPRAFSEAQAIAEHILNKRGVILNLHRVTPEQGRRIIDFLSGTVNAVSGDIQKIGPDIFLCSPKNISVAGEISDQIEEVEKKW